MSKLERQDGILAGVCGGLAKQMNIDPWIVRIGVIVATFFSVGVPVLLYIVGAAAIPKAPELPAGPPPPSKLADGSPPPAAGTIFCGKCGTKNSTSDRFCKNCGHDLQA